MSFVFPLRGRRLLLARLVPSRLTCNEIVASEPDSSAPAPAPARREECILLALRKQQKGQIVNGWLILIGVVGSVIAVADGLTHPPNYDLQPPPSLQYNPDSAAFLLAGITLPLAFAYARRARVSLTEALFLWFVFCTAAYTKDFSYLRLPGVPLFVTDIVLLLLLTSIYIFHRRCRPRLPSTLTISLALFAAAGALAAARGFLGGHDSVLVLRDSAIVGYSLFIPVGYHLTRNWLLIRRVAAWFALGAALSVLNGAACFVVVPEQMRFLLGGIYALISLVIVLLASASRLIPWKAGWVLAVYFCLGLLLANMRSIFVSLGGVLLLALVIPGLLREKIRSALLTRTLITATLVTGLSLFVFFHVKSGRELLKVLESRSLHVAGDPNWQFRLLAWKEAWKRFENSPLDGEGFGIPFDFEIWSDPRPHNTFLTVLYKMGLIGFLPFLTFLGSFFWQSLRAVRQNLENRRVAFLQIVILVQLCFCLYGTANLLLESPFFASLFWTGMGIGLRTIHKLDFERLVTRVHPWTLGKESRRLGTHQA